MPGLKVTPAYFDGNSNVYSKGAGGLAAIIRGLAIDHARIKIETTAVADWTDNSTGTAAATLVDLTIPTAAYNAVSSGGATRTDWNTALGKFENAGAVIASSLNNARARIGLGVMSFASGTVASADTIPAQDLSVNTTSGATSLDFVEGVASMQLAKANLRKIVKSFNELMTALGEPSLVSALTGDFGDDYALVAIPDAAASSTGASAISKTVADAFLAALAANIATLAVRWNYAMFQTGLSDLTDSSGGTAAAGLVANAAPALAAGAATTSSPKVGFDAELVKIENNIADLALRTNLLLGRFGETLLTDSTGATANTTVEALSVTLTAVDGSTGTDAVDGATARTRMGTINNALKSIAAKINVLCPYFGVTPLTDALVGTASNTLANIAATGTGVGEDVTPGATLLDSAVDAWLVTNRHNIATLAGKLNALTGTGVPTKPLSVVAA